MGRAENGIHNPNAPIPELRKESESHDGKRALKYALIVGVAIMGNFGLGRAVQNSADSIFEGGHFRDGMYHVYRPGVDASFYCGEEGTVLKRELFTDELGEASENIQNMGHPEACPELTTRDGKFWQEKINQLGLVGLAFKQF